MCVCVCVEVCVFAYYSWGMRAGDEGKDDLGVMRAGKIMPSSIMGLNLIC